MTTKQVEKIVIICLVIAIIVITIMNSITVNVTYNQNTPVNVSIYPEELPKTNTTILDNHYIESPTPDTIEKERNDVVIVMDISASMLAEIVSGNGVSFLDYEKALIIDILDDDEFKDDRVGVVAFGGRAYVISELQYLGNDPALEALQDTVMSISPQGQMSTPLEAGLTMAEEMLANSAGAKDVIILSDGKVVNYASSLAIATEMQENGIRMHFIHVMSSPTSSQTKYEDIASAVDASYAQTTYPKSINIESV